jgi:periplasmic protein TonB
VPDPVVERPNTSENDVPVFTLPKLPAQPSLGAMPGEPTIISEPLPDVPAAPVRVEAQLDTRSELQPPYPASEERAGTEGSVTVRVTIGAAGRVKAIEKLSATSEAFFRATQRHAMRHWRFRPATLDGKPVESVKTMRLVFVLRR